MPIYIPIGDACGVAYQLQNLRKEAYPFDWLRTSSLDIITDVINNNFDDFGEFNKVKDVKTYPQLDDESFDVNGNLHTVFAKNKYGYQSYHDFSSLIPFDEQRNVVRGKYQRRIERFYKALNSGEKIIFIRDNTCHNLTQVMIDNFINAIKSINKNIVFEIIIISRIDITFSGVNVVYDDKEFGNWMRPNLLINL